MRVHLTGGGAGCQMGRVKCFASSPIVLGAVAVGHLLGTRFCKSAGGSGGLPAFSIFAVGRYRPRHGRDARDTGGPLARRTMGETPMLREDVGDYLAGDVGEAEISAGVAEGEALVVEAQEVQDGGVEVVDVDLVFDD